MPDVEVRVFKGGKEIAKIRRPLRDLDGKPAVKYKRRLWPLLNDGEIYLDAMGRENHELKANHTDGEGSKSKPEIQVVSPALIKWDKAQRDVIDSSSEDRLLVSAGPGTGKTEVACARVSHLIDQGGLEPSNVWLISFTRTAVHEIRDRIATHLEDAAAAYAVKIATLDSHAWTIHSGFDEQARILGSYEENIEKVFELVREDDSVADYLETMVEHLVVDEAQDIVGVRAELVLAMIEKLSGNCGVTVFADEAQAIYGFADDAEVQSGRIKEPPLPEKIRRRTAGDFRERGLKEVHRTGSKKLLTIFTDTRRKVLTGAEGPDGKLAEIKDDVIRLAHGELPSIDRQVLAGLEDAFILYRRRCDVLLASSFLAQSGVLHRIRMSGLPVCLAPWIGATLSDYTASDLAKETFKQLWKTKVSESTLARCNLEEAWGHLVRLAGRTKTSVNMRLVRQRLGRKQPPAELCTAELGDRGPIVGTIHASKGREADTVHLMLPYSPSENVDQEEEARVVFVGATRGRSKLMVGRGYRQFANRVEASGRAYCLQTKDKKPRAQVEFGRDNDIPIQGLAGRQHFASAEAVRESQERIRVFADDRPSLVAEADRSADFAYRLAEDGQNQCVAVLSSSVNADLFTIARAVQARLHTGNLRPPDVIRHLRVIGIRTVVIPPDAPECELLHEPWASSGILLAPLIIGYTTIYFPRSKEGWRQ